MSLVRSSDFSRRVASHPSIIGSDRSIRMISGNSSIAFAIASTPFGRFGHAEARELQVLRVHLAGVLIVVDDQDERWRGRRVLVIGA